MSDTNIEWATKTWNPGRGCRRVSAGCANCYAERQAIRHAGPGGSYEGLVTMGKGGPRWTGKARFNPGKLLDPFGWKKRERVFVDSMSDLFYEGFSNEEIAGVFAVMSALPRHDFLVLTKRPERARAWFDWFPSHYAGPRRFPSWATPALLQRLSRAPETLWPLPNVWMGVSVEDQATADERIPQLLDIPADVRFVSAEPLIAPVSLSKWMAPAPAGMRLDWVIVGGESGPGARPFAIEWAEQLVRAGANFDVPIFVKQLGAHVVSTERMDGDRWAWRAGFKDPKGGDPAEWPDEVRVRDFPSVPIPF